MSERDLIKDLSDEKDGLIQTIQKKEARIKTITIKLEHATQDVQAVGHKIGEKDKKIADLQAKLETKERLLQEALNKIKDIHDDSTKEDTDTADQELDQ